MELLFYKLCFKLLNYYTRLWIHGTVVPLNKKRENTEERKKERKKGYLAMAHLHMTLRRDAKCKHILVFFKKFVLVQQNSSEIGTNEII